MMGRDLMKKGEWFDGLMRQVASHVSHMIYL